MWVLSRDAQRTDPTDPFQKRGSPGIRAAAVSEACRAKTDDGAAAAPFAFRLSLPLSSCSRRLVTQAAVASGEAKEGAVFIIMIHHDDSSPSPSAAAVSTSRSAPPKPRSASGSIIFIVKNAQTPLPSFGEEWDRQRHHYTISGIVVIVTSSMMQTSISKFITTPHRKACGLWLSELSGSSERPSKTPKRKRGPEVPLFPSPSARPSVTAQHSHLRTAACSPARSPL